MTEKAWLTDTEPGTRYPLYTRLNASDVLPDPVTPLGADLAWLSHILPGWASGYVELGSFTPEEMFSGAVERAPGCSTATSTSTRARSA